MRGIIWVEPKCWFVWDNNVAILENVDFDTMKKSVEEGGQTFYGYNQLTGEVYEG